MVIVKTYVIEGSDESTVNLLADCLCSDDFFNNPIMAMRMAKRLGLKLHIYRDELPKKKYDRQTNLFEFGVRRNG